MEDISSFLSIEVKKEIADRYFRFRKIIEDDTIAYKQNIITLSLSLESSIGFDLVCIYTLLQDEDLIRTFFDFTGISERFFFDCEINTSSSLKKKIFPGRKIHGLTRKSRFKNLLFDTYVSLYTHVNDYRETLCKLTEDQETIREQINYFYRNNDLEGILQFLKNLDGLAEPEFDPQGQEDAWACQCRLEEKMRLDPPDPVDQLLPIMPSIPSPATARPTLKKLAISAWSRHPEFDLHRI